jgi:hypothetical protein
VEKKLFRLWRKERLLKKMETAAAIFTTSFKPIEKNIADEILVPPDETIYVDVTEESDLKPRTVSLEDGEDNVTPPISSNIQKYTPSYFWSGSDKRICFLSSSAQVQQTKLMHAWPWDFL